MPAAATLLVVWLRLYSHRTQLSVRLRTVLIQEFPEPAGCKILCNYGLVKCEITLYVVEQ